MKEEKFDTTYWHARPETIPSIGEFEDELQYGMMRFYYPYDPSGIAEYIKKFQAIEKFLMAKNKYWKGSVARRIWKNAALHHEVNVTTTQPPIPKSEKRRLRYEK
jgi:hypothetical protein